MRRLPSAAAHHGGPLGLSAGVDQLLVDVAADGFTLYCCGRKSAPNALVAAYEWDRYACVDLLTVRDFARVITARVPKHGSVDIFAPEVVIWAYEGRRSRPCGRCWRWRTRRIPMPPRSSTRRQRACTFPAPSNAR